jgi:hypothetical protein
MFLKKVLQICKNWLNLNQKGFAKFPNKNQKKSEKNKKKRPSRPGVAKAGLTRTRACPACGPIPAQPRCSLFFI